MLKSILGNYRDAYILVKGTTTAVGVGAIEVLKNYRQIKQKNKIKKLCTASQLYK